MPNGKQGLTRESFVNAWTSGDMESQAGYLYDLIEGQRDEIHNDIKPRLRKLEHFWSKMVGVAAVIISGAAVISILIRLKGL